MHKKVYRLSINPKKLLVIGHVWPQPNATAAGEHIMHLLRFFQDLNFEILVVSAAQKPNNYSVFTEMKIETAQVNINDDNFDLLLEKYQPQVVLFDRFMVEEQFGWRVKNVCSEAIRILDTEDIHFLRKQRQQDFKTGKNEFLSDNAKREIASMYRCDLNLIISLQEIELLKNEYQFPENLLHYTPLLSEKISLEKSFSFEERKDFIFVGNFLHEPNWHAVQLLKKEIWPKLSKHFPNAILHIYGAYAAEKNYQLTNKKERFLVHGYVKDIETELQKSRVMIAPLFFGAGQKGKLLKAMQNGLPSVTTHIGAEAMYFGSNWPGVIENDFNEIVEACKSLYSEKEKWKEAQNNIVELVNKNYNYENHFLVFKKRLETLHDNLKNHRKQNVVGELLWYQSMRSTEFMSRWIIEKNKK